MNRCRDPFVWLCSALLVGSPAFAGAQEGAATQANRAAAARPSA